jgi:hypothetical protein
VRCREKGEAADRHRYAKAIAPVAIKPQIEVCMAKEEGVSNVAQRDALQAPD